MAGHSKWANIRHRKAAQDKKRGAAWTKCSKAIIVAARRGGPDPAMNPSLRYAIDEAKYANMPKDTIKRAIEKGTGSAQGEDYTELVYEAYGPGGTAILIDALTDNNTRTVGEVRMIFKKFGGSLGSTGSVAFMFQTKGRIFVPGDAIAEDDLMNKAIEAGADDVQPPEPDGDDAGVYTILTDAAAFMGVKDALEAAGVPVADAGIAKIPETSVEVRGENARQLVALLEALDDNDDVQKVYSNADIPDEELAGLG